MMVESKLPRRVVVTGVGLLSGLGIELQDVSRSLREGRSTIGVVPEREALGFRSPLSGLLPSFDPRDFLPAGDDPSVMSESMLYSAIATRNALADSGIDLDLLDSERVGVMIGNDSSAQTATIVLDTTRSAKGPAALGKDCFARSINSSASVYLARRYGARAGHMSVSAACSSGAHAIGLASLMIRMNWADRMIAGGCQELCWESMAAFDALKAFSTETDHPDRASRPFDKDRQGLVPSGGGAVLLLEDLEIARARGATIWGEIVAYAATADGHHLTNPSSDGAARCIRQALEDARVAPAEVDYINAHATGTQNGDISEARAINEVFGSGSSGGAGGPAVSSTKSMTGHECWMAGASEIAYSLIMMRDGFVAPNINFTGFADDMPRINIVPETEQRELDCVLSNSFGFGGTNASVLLKRCS